MDTIYPYRCSSCGHDLRRISGRLYCWWCSDFTRLVPLSDTPHEEGAEQ